MIVGVGTGSTVAFFIDALARMQAPHRGRGFQLRAEHRALARGTASRCWNSTPPATLALYVDGADECDPHKRLIKGGGAALTREKIIAEASETLRLHHRRRASRCRCSAGSRCRSR